MTAIALSGEQEAKLLMLRQLQEHKEDIQQRIAALSRDLLRDVTSSESERFAVK
jgi:hypothetical protein